MDNTAPGTLLPTTDSYPDVVYEEILIPSRHGGQLPALLYRPALSGRHPGVVLAAEAYGLNDFTRRVGATLAHFGQAVVVPDYYRGKGLRDPENYQDFTEVMEFIAELDFIQATHDVMDAAAFLRADPDVDSEVIHLWGYCTGGTLALLASCLDDVAGSVLFFPSQPTFPELTPRRPVNPIDLLWNARSPLLFIYGEADDIMTADRRADLSDRLRAWGVPHEIEVYQGAGHAFSAPVPPLRNDAADRLSWQRAMKFLHRRNRGGVV
jgi:carboxymethylenebutenolidase